MTATLRGGRIGKSREDAQKKEKLKNRKGKPEQEKGRPSGEGGWVQTISN